MNIPLQVNLSNKVAVVTGGNGVLGSYFSKALARCGAKVAILGRNQDTADQVAREIIEEGGEALGVAANVLQRDSLEKARELIENKLGACDILVNNAGGNHPLGTTDDEFFDRQKARNHPEYKTFFDLDSEGVEFVFELNFLGTFLPSQVFAKAMTEREGGCIINISSMNAYTPLTKIPAYSGAKAAINNFTQWLSVYFAKAGIRVNAIAPGFFVTKQNESLLYKEDGSPSPRAENILHNTPMDRFGEPEELVGGLLFLASDKASSFITGMTLPIDGGFSSYSGV
ncbi:D-mannonate oxidoreductase [Niallia circulans]|uniref:SDR family oxidoreductase n=1 Tax=Niallia circulans TaxID=1397 RepID=UPI000BA74AD1|nr:SDR family oxidoreductase [Niallia circulans]NRG34942.1 SDR family oxidoreductase [Niallia circulans]PAD89026.1 D-mannonate oxidoreductase [Niallia circulans]PAE10421.1 D-mannonate oxidoreductase [Niallia circulans]